MITDRVPDLHPDSSKFYRIAWRAGELGASTTIDSVTWTVPAGLQNDEQSQSGLTVGVRLSDDGTAVVGQSYDVLCEIETSTNETLHEGIRITVSTDGH